MKRKRWSGLVAATYTLFKTDSLVALPQFVRGEVCRALLIPVCQWLIAVVLLTAMTRPASAQSAPQSLDAMLKAADVTMLAQEAQRRGDPKRGALLFYKSAAGCVKCHISGPGQLEKVGRSPLGPDLATLEGDVTGEHVIESILLPSRKLRKGYETVQVLTVDGNVLSGLLVEDKPEALILRDAANLEKEIVIQDGEIEAKSTVAKSMMPDGLTNSLRNAGEFFDLASYAIEVARRGQKRAEELKPSAEQLAIQDEPVFMEV